MLIESRTISRSFFSPESRANNAVISMNVLACKFTIIQHHGGQNLVFYFDYYMLVRFLLLGSVNSKGWALAILPIHC